MRCLRACSSDQKKRDLRQKSSMMLGAFSVEKSTIGTKKMGLLARSARVYVRSCRIVKWIGVPQHPHSVPISKERAASLSLPCTKGVATASVPHAALSRSPVLNSSRCGVSATVTG